MGTAHEVVAPQPWACPGDRLERYGVVERLGFGTGRAGGEVVAMACGGLAMRRGKVAIEASVRRYVPEVGHTVVGMVRVRHGESFEVDVGSAISAFLPMMHFQGATRRNRPSVDVGDVLHARVTRAGRGIETELSCVDAQGQSAGFGHLKQGCVLRVPLDAARDLRSGKNPMLASLGETIPFSAVVGGNGRVWVHGKDHAATALVARAITSSIGLGGVPQVEALARRFAAEHLTARAASAGDNDMVGS